MVTGTYSFFAVLFNTDGPSQPTPIVVISLTQIPLLVITSSPPLVARVGQEYVYKPVIENVDNVELLWFSSFPYGSDFFRYDFLTGEVRWTQNNPGSYNISLVASAKLDLNFRARQDWTVVVTPANQNYCAVISGTVRDQNQQPVSRGGIDAIQLDDGSGSGGAIASGEITKGKYIFLLKQEGTYVLRARGVDFLTTWYDHDTSLVDAKRLQVKCADSLFADFEVVLRQKVPIRGHVMNVDGKPVKSSVRIRNTEGVFLDSALTKQDGSYQSMVPEGFDCVAYAFPYDPGYRTQFFNLVEDVTQVTTIYSGGDPFEVDFVLRPYPNYNNGIFGTMRNDSGGMAPGFVVAYPLPSNGNPPDVNAAATVLSGAGFFITNLEPGNHVLFAVPDKNYLPGFYKSNTIAVDLWQNATVVTVPASGYVYGKNIIVGRRKGIQGVAKLQGSVSSKTGKIRPGGSQTNSITVLAGALIKILDQNNQVSDYGFSNSNGLFELRESGIGKYSVVVNRIGYDTYQSPVEFDYSSKSIVQTSIQLQPSTPVSVGDRESTIAEKIDVEVYPNPASSLFSLKIRGEEKILRVRLYDRLGREMFDKEIERSGAYEQVSINASNYTNGLYFVKVSGAKNEKTVLLLIFH